MSIADLDQEEIDELLAEQLEIDKQFEMDVEDEYAQSSDEYQGF